MDGPAVRNPVRNKCRVRPCAPSYIQAPSESGRQEAMGPAAGLPATPWQTARRAAK